MRLWAHRPCDTTGASPPPDNPVRDIAVSWAQANIELLTSPPKLAGDYNADGSVDAADFVMWRKAGGSPDDYNTWQTHFGASLDSGFTATSSVTALAAPEPATLVLLFVAVALSPPWRRTAR